MEHSNIQFIRVYWRSRNCQNSAYRKGNRAMLKYFIGKERARRARVDHKTAGL